MKKKDNNFGMITGAEFSEDKKYRYVLHRIWNEGLEVRYAMCIGLNPSTANGVKDDATIRRLKSLIMSLGYGGFFMCNLFSFITPYPKFLATVEVFNSEAEKCNDEHLFETHKHCADVIFCWGSFEVWGRDKDVIAMFPDAMCFGVNQNGSPKHPLYLPMGTKLKRYQL